MIDSSCSVFYLLMVLSACKFLFRLLYSFSLLLMAYFETKDDDLSTLMEFLDFFLVVSLYSCFGYANSGVS